MIPIQLVQDDGSVCKDRMTILNKWQTHFQSLLNANSTAKTVPETELPQYQEPINGLRDLNKDISLEDVIKAFQQAKLGKAICIYSLPVEVLKNPVCANFLVSLFNICFRTSQIPFVWGRSVITPLHKDSSSETHEPSNNRGISITSSVYKFKGTWE